MWCKLFRLNDLFPDFQSEVYIQHYNTLKKIQASKCEWDKTCPLIALCEINANNEIRRLQASICKSSSNLCSITSLVDKNNVYCLSGVVKMLIVSWNGYYYHKTKYVVLLQASINFKNSNPDWSITLYTCVINCVYFL